MGFLVQNNDLLGKKDVSLVRTQTVCCCCWLFPSGCVLLNNRSFTLLFDYDVIIMLKCVGCCTSAIIYTRLITHILISVCSGQFAAHSLHTTTTTLHTCRAPLLSLCNNIMFAISFRFSSIVWWCSFSWPVSLNVVYLLNLFTRAIISASYNKDIVLKGNNPAFFWSHVVRHDVELDQIVGMKTWVHRPVPSMLPDCHNGSSSSVQRKLWQHCDRGTNCILPLLTDVLLILMSARLCDWTVPKCPVQMCNLRLGAICPSHLGHLDRTKAGRTWDLRVAPPEVYRVLECDQAYQSKGWALRAGRRSVHRPGPSAADSRTNP